MEYVQTVMARIAAAKFDDALRPGGLMSELEAHRDVVAARAGSRGMNVARSANPEGDVLVVVETRWSSNNALADYSANAPNAERILKGHQDLLTADGVEVHRMQSEQAPGTEAPTRAYDRLVLPLAIPVGVLAFALLIIYGLSRIYLTLPGNWATPLAAGIALGVLGAAWYFATHPAIPRIQIAGFFVVVLAVFAGAATTAAVRDSQNAEKKTVEASPTAAAGANATAAPSVPGALALVGKDLKFDKSTLEAKAGTVVIEFDNQDSGVMHNLHVFKGKDASGESVGATDIAMGPTKQTLTLNLQPGTYYYQCDVHQTTMTGKLVVQ